MNDIAEQYLTKDNRKLTIYYDRDYEYPLTAFDYDNIIFFFAHKRYELGTKNYNFSSSDEMITSIADEYLPKQYREGTCDKYGNFEGTWIDRNLDDYKTILKAVERYTYVIPVYMYDHSGISLSTGPFSCPWDSGQVGYICMSKKDARKNWKGKANKVRTLAVECMESIINTLDNAVTGNVYGFEIETIEGEIESCCGFYGNDHNKSGLYDYAGIDRKDLRDYDNDEWEELKKEVE